jgi:hypothetical protein
MLDDTLDVIGIGARSIFLHVSGPVVGHGKMPFLMSAQYLSNFRRAAGSATRREIMGRNRNILQSLFVPPQMCAPA